MAYRSLRDFIDVLEAKGELVRVKEPVSSVLEMTEIQTRLLGDRRSGGAVRARADAGRFALADAGPGQSVRHGQAGGHGRHPGRRTARPPRANCARWANCWPSCASPTAAQGAEGRAGDAAPGQDRHERCAQDGEEGAGAGDRAHRRPDRPDQAAGPDLLAGRARAADHLAAGRHQGPRARTARTTSTSASTACRCWARTAASCAGWPIAAGPSTMPATRRPASASPCPPAPCWAPIPAPSWPP